VSLSIQPYQNQALERLTYGHQGTLPTRSGYESAAYLDIASDTVPSIIKLGHKASLLLYHQNPDSAAAQACGASQAPAHHLKGVAAMQGRSISTLEAESGLLLVAGQAQQGFCWVWARKQAGQVSQ